MGSTAMRIAAGAACIATLVATSGTAKADPSSRLAIDWGKLIVQFDDFARHRAGPTESGRSSSAGTGVHTPQPMEQTAGNAWFGVEPHVAIVARDWGSAFRLAGDRLTLADAMRLSQSTRMVLTRVRLNDARVTPFAQFGVGQWRTDPNILPMLPRTTEIASQVGGGVEIRLWQDCYLAAETTATLIVRDTREPNDLPQTRLWSAMIASRFSF